MVIARTDARSSLGFEAAVERAMRMAEAGADMLFVEAPETLDEVRQLPALLSAPQVMNIVVGGKTPTLAKSELAALGYGMVLYANTGLQGALLGMQKALGVLRADGIVHEDPSLLVPFLERQRLVNKHAFDAMDKKYERSRPKKWPWQVHFAVRLVRANRFKRPCFRSVDEPSNGKDGHPVSRAQQINH
jgi:2-methylisocitrate lyase-like PEP mutase family enzyme